MNARKRKYDYISKEKKGTIQPYSPANKKRKIDFGTLTDTKQIDYGVFGVVYREKYEFLDPTTFELKERVLACKQFIPSGVPRKKTIKSAKNENDVLVYLNRNNVECVTIYYVLEVLFKRVVSFKLLLSSNFLKKC